jgi:hypothetical protein
MASRHSSSLAQKTDGAWALMIFATSPHEASVHEAQPNNGVQATAYSVRCAPAFSRA